MKLEEMQKEFIIRNQYIKDVFKDPEAIMELIKKDFDYKDWEIFFKELEKAEIEYERDLSFDLIKVINQNNAYKNDLMVAMSNYLLNKDVDIKTFNEEYLPFMSNIDKEWSSIGSDKIKKQILNRKLENTNFFDLSFDFTDLINKIITYS